MSAALISNLGEMPDDSTSIDNYTTGRAVQFRLYLPATITSIKLKLRRTNSNALATIQAIIFGSSDAFRSTAAKPDAQETFIAGSVVAIDDVNDEVFEEVEFTFSGGAPLEAGVYFIALVGYDFSTEFEERIDIATIGNWDEFPTPALGVFAWQSSGVWWCRDDD